MKLYPILLLGFLFLPLNLLRAQEIPPEAAALLGEQIEEYVSRTDEVNGQQELFEKLEELRKDPLNLNTASREDLEQLKLLNDFQVVSLLDYRQQYGALASMNELLLVPGFNAEMVQVLSPLVQAAPPPQDIPTLREAFRNGSSSYLIRAQSALQAMQGSLDSTGYPGSQAKIYTRYAYSYRNLLRAGFTGEKDAGEAFPAGKGVRLFDFQSGFVQLKNLNSIKSLVLGDYNLRFGQGLVLWSGYAGGKSADGIGMRKRPDGISPCTSSEENRFFRGAAGTLRVRDSEFSLFFSMRTLDANIGRYDSYLRKPLSFSSFRTDGLHLNARDLQEKDAVDEVAAGGNFRVNRPRFRWGMSMVHTRFGSSLLPYRSGYSLYNAAGNQFTTAGADFTFRAREFLFFGEGALASEGGMSFVGGVQLSAAPGFLVNVVGRSYAKNYYAFYAHPISEGGRASNEQGLYSGFQLQLPGKLVLSGFHDYYYFPWMKFNVDAPSSGREELLQLGWDPGSRLHMSLRYRSEVRQQNQPQEKAGMHALIESRSTSFRYLGQVKLDEAWKMQSRVDVSIPSIAGQQSARGYLFSQDLGWKPAERKVALSLRYALFDTDSYENRIYAYESDLLYAFSVPSFYGRGTRIYAMLSFSCFKRVDIWLRLSRTQVTDRTQIGSGLSMIDGNRRTDVGMQMRVRL